MNADVLPRTLQSEYMRFAKEDSAAPYNLVSSGIVDCDLADLGASFADLALHGPNAYGYGPLTERIASRYGVPEDCVVTPGGGCSFANHLAMSALMSPGDEALVESPTYELLSATLECLGAHVRTFERCAVEDWRLIPDEVTSRLTGRTRLVVVSNMHNPSGALAAPEDLEAVARACAAVGAHMLVDEVYLELLSTPERGRTAFRPEGPIVVTNSLTKAYGLSGLRCGWILAPAALARRMRRLNDLYGVAAPHVAERLAVVAFDRLGALRERATAILQANHVAYAEHLAGHPGLIQTVFPQATTVFPRLAQGDGDALLTRLRARHDTSLVPGRHFGRADHVRIALGGRPEATREGLRRVALALNESD